MFTKALAFFCHDQRETLQNPLGMFGLCRTGRDLLLPQSGTNIFRFEGSGEGHGMGASNLMSEDWRRIVKNFEVKCKNLLDVRTPKRPSSSTSEYYQLHN